MVKEEILLNSNCDGNPLSVCVCKPESDPKGVIQISHGMIEHKHRYSKTMEYLTNKGYIVVISDHRGHGYSVKSKDDLGYFYDDKGDYVVEDLHQVTEFIKDNYPNLKITLIGHSMGSLIARKYLKKYDDHIDRLIVCGSPSYNSLVKPAIFFINIVKIFKGDRYRSSLLENLTLNNFSKGLEGNDKQAWLSSNKATLDSIKSDNLTQFKFTLNGYLNLYRLLISVYHKKDWQMKNKDLKILFISGQEDKALVNKSKWFAAQDLLKDVGYSNITCKLYPGFRHELLNEMNNDMVFDDIISFIEV